MPKKVEMSNRYRIFQVEEEKKEAEEIGAIKSEEDSAVVRQKTCGREAKKEC